VNLLVICPKCKNEIPFNKIIFHANYSNIKCSSCSSDLKPNKRTNSILGAVGGGIGAGFTTLFLMIWLRTGELFFILLLIPLLLIEFFVFSLISIKIMKLEIKEPYQNSQQITPPPIKMS
jgi:hypothetical protein